MTTRREIRQYMLDNWQDNVDLSCNVLNATGLAEDACMNFDLYEQTEDMEDNIPEFLFEMAYEVEEHLIKEGFCQR